MNLTKSKLILFAMFGLLFGAFPLHAQTPTPIAGTGAQPVAVLFCQYSDKPNTYGFTPAGVLASTWLPNPVSYNGTTVDNSISGLVQDASLGTINFQGSQAFGWYKLPNPLSYYAAIGDPDPSSFQVDGAQVAGNDCIAAAQKNGANLASFTYVAVYMNDLIVGATGESWTANLPKPSATVWNALIVGVRGLTSPPLVLHELGHILSNGGFHTDSGTDPLGAAAYLGDDPSNPNAVTPWRVASVSPEWDASRRELMGFIPTASNPTFPGGTQTYKLSRLTQPLPGLPTAIDVPLPNGAKYVISARTQIGYDSDPIFFTSAFLGNTVASEGVRIELFASPTVDAHIERSTPGPDPYDSGAVWLTGQTYTDTINGITISVVNFNSTGTPTAQITVSSGLSGTYKLNPQNAPTSCLDVFGGGTSPGTNVDIYGCNGGTNQNFSFTSQGNNIYQIQPSYSSALCLDVYGAATSPGSAVDVWSCNNGTNQQWSAISDGGNVYEFAPQNISSFRLDVYGGGASNGTQVDIWPANGGSNQKWALNH